MVVYVECLPADKPWDVVSVTRRSSGVAPRACVRVYARVLVPPNLYIHTYTGKFLYFLSYLQGDTHVTKLASPPTHSTFRPCLDTLSLPSSPYLGILTTEGEPLFRSPPAHVQLNKNRPITAW